MQAISHFVRTTILGGILFLTPIAVLGYFLSKAYSLVRRALDPVAALLPDGLPSGGPAVLAILFLALVSFLAGLLARTIWAQRMVNGLEASVLSKIPGYEYLKQAGASVIGAGEMDDHPVVLAELGGALRIGLQTDVLPSGLVAVFVPNSPNPTAGGVFLVPPDRVRPAGIPLAAAMGCLRRCGTGSAQAFSGLSAG